MSFPSDVETRMTVDADGLRVGEPPIEQILRGGRRRRLRRRASQAVAGCLVLGLLGVVFTGLRGLGDRNLRLSNGVTLPKPVMQATVALPADAIPAAMAAGDGSIWVVDAAGSGRLIGIVAGQQTFSSAIPLGARGAYGIVIVGSSAWVSAQGELIVVDLHAKAVVRRVPLPSDQGAVSSPVMDVAYGFGSIWATWASGPHQDLFRLDPETGAIQARIPMPLEVRRVVVGDGYVWVAACSCEFQAEPPTILRIDPAQNTIAQVMQLPGSYAQYGSVEDMAVGWGVVWAVSYPRTGQAEPPGSSVTSASQQQQSWLWRVDEHGGAAGPRANIGRGQAAVVLARGGIWVLHREGGSTSSVLSLIDPSTGAFVGARIPTGSLASAVVFGDGSLWVSAFDNRQPVIYQVRP